jgi:nucleotide-binding universal stress UspA family protein
MGYADISGEISSSSIREISDMVKQEAQRWFDKIKLKTDQLKIDLKTDVVVSKTNATHTIVDYADSEKVDLIVMGTRGKSGFKKLLVGSTASGVVTYASCPVMVVK